MTDTTAKLTRELEEWTKGKYHTPTSADELRAYFAGEIDTAAARLETCRAYYDYLSKFCKRWDAAQAREDNDERRFAEWRATRQWFHDLRDSEVADDCVTGPGYCYGGLWIRLNTDERQELGRYWTMCPFDLWGDLDTVERALWNECASDIDLPGETLRHPAT